MNLSKKLSIKDICLKDKRVLVRVDYNVPLSKDLKVEDNRRIDSTVDTIKMIFDKGAKSVVLMSHLGRPNGQKKPELSLKHIIGDVQKALANVTKKPIVFIESCESPEYKAATESPEPGTVYLLENLRFNIAEEGKGENAAGEKIKATEEQTKKFRATLSKLGDVFVFDAFAAAHRAHSSVVGIDIEQKAAGLLMDKELTFFAAALEKPEKPFLSILGGAKVSDKIQLIESLLDKVDEMIIGGGMAYTFLKVIHGYEIGTSLFDEAGSKLVKDIMAKAEAKNVKIHLPVDFITADDFNPKANVGKCTAKEGIPDEWMGLDCGPESRKKFDEVVKRAKTIVWNGPLGVFEFDNFCNGTKQVLQSVADRTAEDTSVISIIGGGDTASAAEKFGFAKKMKHISTGGGASLELLEVKILPGVKNLSDKQ